HPVKEVFGERQLLLHLKVTSVRIPGSRECQNQHCGCHDCGPMFPNELLCPIQHRCWSRQYRILVEMSAAVSSKFGRGRISTRPILVHGFERNPVEIAPELTRECTELRPTLLGDGTCHAPQAAETRARAQRFLFANDPLDLCVAGTAQHSRVKWQRAN